jgi:trimeric autotransporter adhesin
MDTTPEHLKQGIFLLAATLLIAAPASADDSIWVNGSGATSATITLSGSCLSRTVDITSQNDNVAFSFNPRVGSNIDWFTVYIPKLTTPVSFVFQLADTTGLASGTSTTFDLVTPPGSSDGSRATVTVQYVVGGSCGGGGGTGQFTVTPYPAQSGTTMALSASSGSATGYLYLANGTSSPVNYAAGVSDSWLSVSPSSGTVAPNTQNSLTVTADSTGLSTGTHLGSITVSAGGAQYPIGVNFTVASSGGGGSSTLTADPASVSFPYTPGGTVPENRQIHLQSTSGATVFRVTDISTTGGGGWLGAGGPSGISVTSGWGDYISNGVWIGLTSRVVDLDAGSYSASITLTAGDGATATISVLLTVNGVQAGITLSPASSYRFDAPSGSSTPLQTTFTITASSEYSLGIPQRSTHGGGNWLTITAAGNSSARTIYATASPAGLADGTYTGTIAVQGMGPNGPGTISIQVTLIVGSGGDGLATSGILPSSLSFAYQASPSIYTGMVQAISVSGAQDGLFSSKADQPWIQVYPTSITAPGTFTVTIYPVTLPAGSYGGNVIITDADGNPTSIPVSLRVTGAGAPVLEPFEFGDAVFTYQSGGSPPESQGIAIYTSDGSSPALSLSSIPPWANAQVAADGKTVVITANPEGLATGAYCGSLTVTASLNYINSPLLIPVILVVNGGGTSGPLTLSRKAMSFTAPLAGSIQTQNLSVTAGTSTSFTASTSGDWLSIAPSGALKTDQTIVVSANPYGLSQGSYTGTITLLSGEVTQTVHVTLQVGSSGGDITVAVPGQSSPPALDFTYRTGGQPTAAQSLDIAPAQGSAAIPVAVTTSTDDGADWLSTSQCTATTCTLTVSVTPGALAPGTYEGKVTITPTGGTAVAVPVTLTVQAGPSLSVSTAALTFSYQAGGQAPSPGSVQVTGTGTNPGFSVSVATQAGGDWLSVTPTSGNVPQTLSVTVTPGLLNSGTYTGTITVAGADGTAGSSTVNVGLTVTAPLPTIDRIVNAATGVAGPIAPGELVSMFAPVDGTHPIGPATAAQTSIDDSGNVATTLSQVQVSFGGFPAPLLYVSAGRVDAVVPYELKLVRSPWVQVKFLGQSSNILPLAKAAVSPGLFTANGSGSGPGTIANQDGSHNGPDNPAARGAVVTLYMTGEGETLPTGVTGKVTRLAASEPLTPQPLLPVGVTIDGRPVNVVFYGEAPEMVSGVMMLQVVIPDDARTGNLPIVVSVGGVSSQNDVTVSVK